MLADALMEEFSRRGALRPLHAARGGDLVLSGSILRARVRAAVFSSVDYAAEDELRLSVRVQIRNPASGQTVWQASDLRISEKFLSSPDPQVYESNKQQALRRLSALLAERVHDGLIQNF